jgi:hypothetical protein
MCGHRCRTIGRPIAIAIALTILAAGSADAVVHPADVIYLDLADTEESSVPLRIGSGIGAGLQLDVGAQLELEAWVVQAAGAYDVYQTDRANLGV